MDEINRRRIERLRRDLAAAETWPELANQVAVARLREQLRRLERPRTEKRRKHPYGG